MDSKISQESWGLAQCNLLDAELLLLQGYSQTRWAWAQITCHLEGGSSRGQKCSHINIQDFPQKPPGTLTESCSPALSAVSGALHHCQLLVGTTRQRDLLHWASWPVHQHPTYQDPACLDPVCTQWLPRLRALGTPHVPVPGLCTSSLHSWSPHVQSPTWNLHFKDPAWLNPVHLVMVTGISASGTLLSYTLQEVCTCPTNPKHLHQATEEPEPQGKGIQLRAETKAWKLKADPASELRNPGTLEH